MDAASGSNTYLGQQVVPHLLGPELPHNGEAQWDGHVGLEEVALRPAEPEKNGLSEAQCGPTASVRGCSHMHVRVCEAPTTLPAGALASELRANAVKPRHAAGGGITQACSRQHCRSALLTQGSPHTSCWSSPAAQDVRGRHFVACHAGSAEQARHALLHASPANRHRHSTCMHACGHMPPHLPQQGQQTCLLLHTE